MKKYIQTVITHPLFSGSTIMVVGSNSASLINTIYHFTMTRMLGPVNYGELLALISSIGLLGILPVSISLVIVKYISSAKNDTEISNLVNWFKAKIFISSVIFTIFILIISPLITSFLNIHNNLYLVLIAISFLFSLQSGLNRSILQGLLKFKEMIISILVENSVKLTLSIILVYMGFQLGGVMFSLIIAAICGLYMTNLYLRYYPTKKTVSPDIKPILIFTIPVAIQTIATTSLYSADVILVKHFFSSYEAGLYAALSTLGKIIFFGAGPIGAVMFPLVSQRKTKGQSFKRIFIYSLIATGGLSLIVTLLYLFVPKLAINILVGGNYIEAENLLVWFAVFISLFTLSSLFINYNLSLGRTKVSILPLTAAITQIIAITLFHQSLFIVILTSIIITALLLVALLIYSSLGSEKFYGDKVSLGNRTGI